MTFCFGDRLYHGSYQAHPSGSPDMNRDKVSLKNKMPFIPYLCSVLEVAAMLMIFFSYSIDNIRFTMCSTENILLPFNLYSEPISI